MALHVVFANAGINGIQCPIEEMTLDEWHATINANLTSTFLTVKHAVAELRAAGGASIILTSSINGTPLFWLPGYAAYSTSKGGRWPLPGWPIELARWGIRVNVILPGSVRTDIGDCTYRRNLEPVTYDIRLPESWSPLHGRSASADEIARLVTFLASVPFVPFADRVPGRKRPIIDHCAQCVVSAQGYAARASRGCIAPETGYLAAVHATKELALRPHAGGSPIARCQTQGAIDSAKRFPLTSLHGFRGALTPHGSPMA